MSAGCSSCMYTSQCRSWCLQALRQACTPPVPRFSTSRKEQLPTLYSILIDAGRCTQCLASITHPGMPSINSLQGQLSKGAALSPELCRCAVIKSVPVIPALAPGGFCLLHATFHEGLSHLIRSLVHLLLHTREYCEAAARLQAWHSLFCGMVPGQPHSMPLQAGESLCKLLEYRC